jgi:molybdopterin molybdotransferase
VPRPHSGRSPDLTWEEARSAALRSAGEPLPAVTRTLPDALGHALAAPLDARLLPVLRTGEGAVPLPFDGPAMLRGLALADGIAVVPPGGAPAGARVRFLGLPER